ncbi:hypothetical protein XA68_16633 [Ophiocordyceps unilateralis]|uniref:Uncharacterized protein n=1 Tax=Ophiocordyceps unilateralis TaxID=268505 RepID=A0A2A9PPN2_OPHUN|nr:hypothetical protein XA68_16633 [Ophiocordyceps unilateralis]
MVNLPLIIVNGPQSFNHCVYSVSPPPNLRRRPYGPGSSIDAVLYDALQSPSVFEMRPNLLDSEPDEFFTQNQPKPAVLSRKPPKNPGLLHPRWVPRRPHPPKRLARVPSNISDGEDSKKLLTPSVGSPESQVGSASVGQDTEVTDYTYHFVQESPQDGEIDDDACDEGVDEWIYGETDEEEGDSDDDEMSQPMFPWTRPWRRQRLDEPGEWLCWVCEVTLAEGEEEAFVRVPGHPFRQRHCSYCTQLSYCKLFVL